MTMLNDEYHSLHTIKTGTCTLFHLHNKFTFRI